MKPPKPGEPIYVAGTQVHGYVVDPGKPMPRDKYLVEYERKNTIHEGLVFRDPRKGRLRLDKDLGVKGRSLE